MSILAACQSGSEPSTIAIDAAPSLNIGQGDTATITVTLTRSHFDQPVHFSVTGGAGGVSATMTPSTIAGGQLTAALRVVALGAATPGTVQLTVHATADGVAAQTITVDVTVAVTGSYTLGTSDATVRVAQSGENGTTVLVNRVGGHADSVHLSVTDAPAGITATLQPTATVTGDAWLDVTASGNVAPGVYQLTIHGTANDLSEQTTTFNVRVIAPPATASITIPFCAGQEPSWFAYQNDGAPWTPVAMSNSSFTFDATSKLGVAFTFIDGSFSEVIVYYGTRVDFGGINTRDCDGSIGVTGKTQGLLTGQQAAVAMAGVSDVTTPTGPQFSLSLLPSRPLDLIGTSGVPLAGGSFNPDKMVIYRGLTPANADTVPTLDFAGADAFSTATSTLTIVGRGNFETTQAQVTLWSATSSYGLVQLNGNAPASMTLFSVPAANLAAGDVHELALFAGPASGNSGRELYSYYDSTGDRTETFGPILSATAITNFAQHPYLRLRGQMTSQPEYDSFARFVFEQATVSDDRIIVVGATANYLGAEPPVWSLTIPNFGSPAGFDPNWMPRVGQSTSYYSDAFSGAPKLLFGAVPSSGDRITDAYVIGQPLSLRARRGLRDIHSRRFTRSARALGRQYFSR